MNDENKRAGENAESSPFNLRLPHATRDALDAVAAQLPILSKHRIAVAALDIGLAALAANPAMVLSVKVAPSGGAGMRGAMGAGPRGAGMRGAMGAGPRGASTRGAAGASGSAMTRGAAGASGAATDDQMPEEPPLVRAPSVPPRRATMPPAPNPSRYGSRYGSPLPALPTPRVPTDIVVPEAVELDDDHEPVEARHTEPPAAPALDEAAVCARIKALQAAEPGAWSLRKIAALAGVSTAPVAKVLNGQKVTPKYLAAIAAILPPEHTGKAST